MIRPEDIDTDLQYMLIGDIADVHGVTVERYGEDRFGVYRPGDHEPTMADRLDAVALIEEYGS